MIHPERFFDPDPSVRKIAAELYDEVKNLPLICPHGHVDPALFAKNESFPDPAHLIIIPDHYVFRMLYSQGIRLENIGIKPLDNSPYETDPRKIWKLFCEHFYLFAGTPTGIWLKTEFEEVFGVEEKPEGRNAMRIYDRIAEKLAQPDYLPRALFERFKIEVLSTTDGAADTLEHHTAIRESGWKGTVVPCFRPDDVTNLLHPAWRTNIGRLSGITGIDVTSFKRFIEALEQRRAFFKSMGAVSTDHGIEEPYIRMLSETEAAAVFEKALSGEADPEDARRFTGHMMMEMARMSTEDGLVMQIHPGSYRNHNLGLFRKFGPDKGADIPVATEFTRNMREILNTYGNNPKFTLVVFTLDESTYSRELAPLAGHYPAMKLGPAWWFHDSIRGMIRQREGVLETAGVYNLIGFIDDTRAFPSIPARHDMARRVDCNYLAGLAARHIIDTEDALRMAKSLSYGLSQETYRV
ncbi:MAG: glucuronate isomerase [Spirochaetales bacterium]|nr:glucuronate isomerase [Spirochaetales bacterium]